MENRHRKLIAPWLGIAAIIVAVVVFMMLTMQPKSVDLPRNDATPEQVVSAYVQALDAGDCHMVEALVTQQNRESAAWWCENVARMGDALVSEHIDEQPEWSNHMSPDKVVNVPVTFDLRWRFLHLDPAMDEGHTEWGYLLVRSSREDPWRIFADGNG